MKPMLPALLLSVALSGAAIAQEMRLSGTVAEQFGRQIVVETPEGRILVTLPPAAAVPAIGERVAFEGRAEGQAFTASRMETGPAAGGPGATPRPAPPPPPAPGPVSGPFGADLPPELAGLGLSDVITRYERSPSGNEERKIHARLPGDVWLMADLRNGRLTKVDVSGGPMPQALIDAMLPPSLRDARELGEFARITQIERKPEGEIEIEGQGRDGSAIEVEYWPDGRLKEYDRDRADRRLSMSEAAARAELARLGYRDVGFVSLHGRHVEAVARNPWGDWVELRIDDRGRIDRERAFVR